MFMALSDRLELVNPSEIRKLFDLAQGVEGLILSLIHI
jgi:aminotransferase